MNLPKKLLASPHPGEVGSKSAQEVVATADIEEGEEEEEEDPDIHFKRKRRSPPPVVSPQKKRKKTVKPLSRHRGTLQIREAEALHAPPLAAPVPAYIPPLAPPVASYVPPSAPPVIEPAASEASMQFVPVTNKISFFSILIVHFHD